MKSIFKIFGAELKGMFANIVTLVITIGLVVMPSIFTWYNVMACWDVFGNTGNLKVAVANCDAGYSSDLMPLPVNIGEEVVSALRANEDIDWMFTDEEDAIDGARSGRYYAAVVIPESFSADMLTFYAQDAEHASIIYYSNEKKNAVAPKITSQGADTISYQVNQVFAQTLAQVALATAQSVSSYVDEAGADSAVADMAAGMGSLAERLEQTAAVLSAYGQLAESSQQIMESSAELIASTRSAAQQAGQAASTGLESAQSTVEALKASATSMSAAIDTTIEGLQGIIDVANGGGSSADSAQTAQRLRQQAAAMNQQIQQYQAVLDAMRSLPEDQQDPDAIAAMEESIQQLTNLRDELNQTAANVEAGGSLVSGNEEIAAAAQAAKEAMETLKASFDESVIPALDELANQTATLAATVGYALQMLDGATAGLESSVSQTAGQAGNASALIASTAGDLARAAQELRELSAELTQALELGDSEAVQNILHADLETYSAALSAPVNIQRNAVFPVANFGSAMTPLYATLALFIGALLIMVAAKPSPSRKVLAKVGGNPKPRHLFLGHFGMVSVLSFLQSSLLALGCLFFLQVQAVHPWLFMVSFWVAGQIFAFIIYTLVASFANLGKAIAVLLLIIQVTGCGGSFPMQLLPGFIQKIGPWLPATHSVNAMRAAMMGVYANDFLASIVMLLLYLVPMLLLGLVLRKPMAKFMALYIRKVEDSKLMA